MQRTDWRGGCPGGTRRSDSRRIRSAKAGRAQDGQSTWSIPSHRSRSSARRRLDRGSRACVWDRPDSESQTAAGSRRFRARIGVTISRCNCGSGSSRAGLRKRAPRRWSAAQTIGAGFAREAVELRNPLSEDHVALRPSLVPGLIAALERNIRAGAKSVRLFEVGRVFLPPHGEEIRRLGLLLCGGAEGRAHWRGARTRPLDLFDLRGALESIGLGEVTLRRLENAISLWRRMF